MLRICRHCQTENTVATCGECGRSFVVTDAHMQGRSRKFEDRPVSVSEGGRLPVLCDVHTLMGAGGPGGAVGTARMLQNTCANCHRDFLNPIPHTPIGRVGRVVASPSGRASNQIGFYIEIEAESDGATGGFFIVYTWSDTTGYDDWIELQDLDSFIDEAYTVEWLTDEEAQGIPRPTSG